MCLRPPNPLIDFVPQKARSGASARHLGWHARLQRTPTCFFGDIFFSDIKRRRHCGWHRLPPFSISFPSECSSRAHTSAFVLRAFFTLEPYILVSVGRRSFHFVSVFGLLNFFSSTVFILVLFLLTTPFSVSFYVFYFCFPLLRVVSLFHPISVSYNLFLRVV